eukprot:3908776-Pyramimonas_sp.AAC.1
MFLYKSSSYSLPTDCHIAGRQLTPGLDPLWHYTPHAEVKLACETTPAWVDDLVDSGLLDVTPKFSKFMHGTAYLRREQIRNSKKVREPI